MTYVLAGGKSEGLASLSKEAVRNIMSLKWVFFFGKSCIEAGVNFSFLIRLECCLRCQ